MVHSSQLTTKKQLIGQRWSTCASRSYSVRLHWTAFIRSIPKNSSSILLHCQHSWQCSVDNSSISLRIVHSTTSSRCGGENMYPVCYSSVISAALLPLLSINPGPEARRGMRPHTPLVLLDCRCVCVCVCVCACRRKGWRWCVYTRRRQSECVFKGECVRA